MAEINYVLRTAPLAGNWPDYGKWVLVLLAGHTYFPVVDKKQAWAVV